MAGLGSPKVDKILRERERCRLEGRERMGLLDVMGIRGIGGKVLTRIAGGDPLIPTVLKYTVYYNDMVAASDNKVHVQEKPR